MISLCSYDSPARKEPQDRRARGLGGESTAAPLGPPGCSHALTGDAQAFLGCNFFSTSSLGRVPRPSVCPVTEVLELVAAQDTRGWTSQNKGNPSNLGGWKSQPAFYRAKDFPYRFVPACTESVRAAPPTRSAPTSAQEATDL